MKVLTDTGLAYYHSKLQNEFVSNSSFSTAIDDYLDNVNWVDIIGDTYATSEDVADMISSADLDAYLSKAGGTMSGALGGSVSPSGTFVIYNSSPNNDAFIIIDGGENYNNGASISIYGKNGTYGGAVFLDTFDGTNRKTLAAYPNGSLTWDGKKIATFDSNNKLVFPNGDTLWFE